MDNMSNGQAQKTLVKSVAEGSVVGAASAYGLTQNAIKGGAIAGLGYLGKDFFADKVLIFNRTKNCKKKCRFY